jgi:long-chain acyl-CoA synthetase
MQGSIVHGATYAPAYNFKRSIVPFGRVDALLDDAVARFGSNKALNFLGRTWTYGDIGDLVVRVAAGLQRQGLKKGDRVGLCLPNTLYSVVFYYAVLKAGGIVVNANPLYVERELEHLIKDSGTTIMVTMDLKIMLPKLAALVGRTPLQKIIVCPMADILPLPQSLMFRLFKRAAIAKVPKTDTFVRYADLLSTQPPDAVEIDPESDIAVLQYTGGTTGTPKAAMLSHANLTANVFQIGRCFPEVVDGKERMLGVLPLFHVFAMTCVMNYGIRIGAELILVPRFEIKQLLATIARYRPTLFPGVPTLYSAISDAVEKTPTDLSSVTSCISGGAPLPMEVRHRFEALSGARIAEGYGLTEASPVVTTSPLNGAAPEGSIGNVVVGTEIEIRNQDGALVGPNERGELCVRGPQVMLGYWNKPEETALQFINGALRTGDVGYVDDAGWYYIVDRLKDLIICSGFNVYPRVLEDALYQHPSVAEAVVIGIPDPYRGQAPKAFVTLHPGASATPDDIMKHMAQFVSKIEMPRQIEIRDSLPRTMVGKLSKKELVAEETAKAPSA